MPIATKYRFIVSMDVAKEKEALFNEVYDTEPVPLLLKVPGVGAVTRWKTELAAFSLGGTGVVKLRISAASDRSKDRKQLRLVMIAERHLAA